MRKVLLPILIHAPYKLEPERAEAKRGILEKIRGLGFDPQEFQVSGIPKGDSWSFGRAIEVMRQCDGALILALMRWMDSNGTTRIPIPSEYSHFEGALALSCNIERREDWRRTAREVLDALRRQMSMDFALDKYAPHFKGQIFHWASI